MEDFGNMFTVMPMNQQIELVPGETITGTVTVVNPADATSDFHYKASVTPYGVVESDYQIDLASKTNYSKIVDWITIENPTGTVKPNSLEEVKFTIKVPEDAAGGGQYATITISSDTETETSESVTVNNVFEMASIIYGQVDGEVNHKGEIKDNSIPVFSDTPPIKISATLTNDGNVHENATIIVKATNMFTGEVILPSDENQGEYNEVIMPETERYTTREIENLPMLGVVHVEQTVYYLGTTSVQSKNVVICPIWFLILVVVTIIGIIAVIVKLVTRHRKKQARNTCF